jgi:hypothetical protein
VGFVDGEGGIDSEESDIFTAVLAAFLDGKAGVVESQESDALAAILVVVLDGERGVETEEGEVCIGWYLRRRYFRHWTSMMSTAIRQVASDSSYSAS